MSHETVIRWTLFIAARETRGGAPRTAAVPEGGSFGHVRARRPVHRRHRWRPRRVTVLIAAGLRVVAVVGAAGLFFGRRVFSGGASWDRAFDRPVRPDEQAGRHPESPRSASSWLATGDSSGSGYVSRIRA